MSLKNICLKFISKNKEQYPQSQVDLLPKHLAREVETTITEDGHMAILSQCGIGQWAGDRIVLISEGKDCTMDGVTYDMARDFPSAKLDMKSSKSLEMLCSEREYKVVNLDKKEYLDPLAYDPGEPNVLKCIDVVTGLLITLFYSNIVFWSDLDPSVVSSRGMWAGNRIIISTPDQLCDFESYKDVSNPIDVKLSRNSDSYSTECCIM